MQRSFWLDPIGAIVALVTFLLSWFHFTTDTSMIMSSFAAAVLTSGLVWISYIMIRWVVISFRGQ